MTSTPRPLAPHRRPPAPAGPRATVTHLGPPGDEREAVPLATVQGTLALDLGALPEAPAVPDLRVVDEDVSAADRQVQEWAARFDQAKV